VPLAAGTEVLVKASFHYALARVERCDGPDAIHVTLEKGTRKQVPLESLVAVTREGLESNMRVYARLFMGWQLTWAEEVTPADAVVKHPNRAFQSDFFNKTVAATDVRIPLRPELRTQRSRLEQWWVERRTPILAGAVIAVVVLLWLLVRGLL